MTTIQSSSSIAAASGAPGASNGSSGNAATEAADRFLTLLVSQLKNQDPLNPMDNAQITTQLTQISTVSGINRLNDTVAALAASFGANQSLQAASLVGHDVLAPGDKLQLAGGKGQGGFSLAQDADQVLITINDASGRAVRKIDLGSQAAGTQAFAWDGQTDAGPAAPDGMYSFAVTATANGKQLAVDTLMSGHVDGVVPGTKDQPTQLQIGRLGRVDLSQVVEIN